MIDRYSRPEMRQIWSDEGRLALWLKIEVAACEAWSLLGEIPKSSLKVIKQKANFDPKRVAEIEAEVHHDVIAFLTSVAEFVGPDARFIHMGITSSALLDTAFAVQLKKAGEIIRADLLELIDSIGDLAMKHKHTPMMGRSHGIHAEPTTFGLKCAVWYAEFERHLTRLNHAIADISVGKISGAVGTFAHLPTSIEKEVCERLGLSFAEASTQIVQRDRHAHYFSVLAGIAASIEKIAVEIRHLQRTEVFEAAEPFGKKQKGSSAMPHKRNPILCENLTGLARVVRANASAALENVALWHERDISHSSVERVIAPDSTMLVDFMLNRLNKIISGLDVFPDKMLENIGLSYGLFASQDVMLALVRKGMAREDAYRLVQSVAMKAWNEKRQFAKLVAEEPGIASALDKKELESIFDLNRHARAVDEIFARVFKKRRS